MKKQKLLFLSLCASALPLFSACGIKIHDAKMCTVNGILSQGAICAHTLTNETEDMELPDFIEFLEAQDEREDPRNPQATIPAHGSAVCMSSEDWAKQKTSMEELCEKVGGACTPEIQAKLTGAAARIDELEHRAEFNRVMQRQAAAANGEAIDW